MPPRGAALRGQVPHPAVPRLWPGLQQPRRPDGHGRKDQEINTDTHFNKGGGGAAYAIRTAPPEIQAGDRVRTYSGIPGRPVYGTVTHVAEDGEAFLVQLDNGLIRLVQLDNGLIRARDLADVTFHGRPHAAFNKGGAQ